MDGNKKKTAKDRCEGSVAVQSARTLLLLGPDPGAAPISRWLDGWHTPLTPRPPGWQVSGLSRLPPAATSLLPLVFKLPWAPPTPEGRAPSQFDGGWHRGRGERALLCAPGVVLHLENDPLRSDGFQGVLLG